MDNKGRTALKRYRENPCRKTYVTTSLTLDRNIVIFLEEKIKHEDDKNMSRFIEEHVTKNMNLFSETIPLRRPYRSKPQKKTFTFTEEFVKAVKKRGRRSFFIESVLKREFGL